MALLDVESCLTCLRLKLETNFKTQGVVEVHRVTMKKEGKVIPTNTLFLTFNRPDVPKEIVVGYLKVKVEVCP